MARDRPATDLHPSSPIRPARATLPIGLSLVALLLGATFGPTAALAQDATSAEARLHFDRAVSLFESGEHRGALAGFQRAYDLTGRASVLYNLGASHQALHDYPRAIDALRRYVAATEDRPTPERALALRALSQMEPLVARLGVTRSHADATVLLDGRVLEGDRARVAPGVGVTRPSVPSQTLFWTMVISGGALAIGATLTGALAIEMQADYATRRVGDREAPELARDGRSLSLTADLFAVGAVAAGVTALVLRLTSHDGVTSGRARVAVAPTVGGAAVTVVGRF